MIQNCFTWKEEVVCCCGLWDSHYIHVCVFWVLISRGLGLTGMFYLVSLYLIVCHLCDVTDIASSDDSQHWRHRYRGLDTDLFDLVQTGNFVCFYKYFITLQQSVCNVAGTAPNSQLPTVVLVIQCNVDFSNNDLKTVWPGEMSDVGYRFIIGLLYFYYCHFLTFQPGQVCILNWQCLFWLRMVLLKDPLSLSLSLHSSILPKKVEKDLDKLQIFPISFSICTVDR